VWTCVKHRYHLSLSWLTFLLYIFWDQMLFIVTNVSCAVRGTSIPMLGLYLEICGNNCHIYSQSLFQMTYMFETVSWCSIIKVKKHSSFLFCWPCIPIYSFKGKRTWCTIYLQYISSNTCTCFGHICSPSSGGTPYDYNNWYLLFFLDYCHPGWVGTISTNCSHTVRQIVHQVGFSLNKRSLQIYIMYK
jgi:hypothetical protein